jgi:hypothetical protein
LLIFKELIIHSLRVVSAFTFTSRRLPSNRFVCQQQRNEIMRRFSLSVNYFVFFSSFESSKTSQLTSAYFLLATTPSTSPILTLQPARFASFYCLFLLPRLLSFLTGGEL